MGQERQLAQDTATEALALPVGRRPEGLRQADGQGQLSRDVHADPTPSLQTQGLQSWFPVPTKPGDVTEQQAEARHIVLDKANHLQLTKCQQLLPWVDDLALGQPGTGSQHRLRPELLSAPMLGPSEAPCPA